MEFPIEMYKIRQEEVKIKVPCERCVDKGIVDKYCHKCGGNGSHNKTIKVWKVAPKTETVVDIDRSTEDSFYKGIQTSYKSGLRYWIGMSDFFNDEDKYLYFCKKDAQKECDRRNINISDILKVVSNNNNKTNIKNNEDLHKQLELERARSNLGKCRANGENPVVVGSYEDIKYITS